MIGVHARWMGILSGLAIGCVDERRATPAVDSGASTAAAAAPGVAAADSVLLARFQAFLDSSVVTRLDSSGAFVGRPERCEADAILPAVDYLLAAGRSLAVARRDQGGATLKVELTVVGEDSVSDVGGPSRHVRLGVRTDTVEWDMVPDSAGAWQPCGYASTQRDLGRMGDRALRARWTPAGAGWDRVAQMTDSLRRARGLPR